MTYIFLGQEEPKKRQLPAAALSRIETLSRCAAPPQTPVMFGATAARPLTIGFFLVPEFPMMAFAAAIEPLRAANRLSGERSYDWRLFSRDGEPVAAEQRHRTSRSTARSATAAASTCCSSAREPRDAGRRRRGRSHGCATSREPARRSAASASAPMSLAHAGCSTAGAARCTGRISPRSPSSFRAIRTTTDIFVIDGDRCTCSGGTAALDMMLELITARMAARSPTTCRSSSSIRASAARATSSGWRAAALGVAHRKLIAAIGDGGGDRGPAPVPRAAASALSPRQLERLFANTSAASPRRTTGGAAGARAPAAAADHQADPGRGAGLRLRLGIPFQQMLPRGIGLKPREARRPCPAGAAHRREPKRSSVRKVTVSETRPAAVCGRGPLRDSAARCATSSCAIARCAGGRMAMSPPTRRSRRPWR